MNLENDISNVKKNIVLLESMKKSVTRQLEDLVVQAQELGLDPNNVVQEEKRLQEELDQAHQEAETIRTKLAEKLQELGLSLD